MGTKLFSDGRGVQGVPLFDLLDWFEARGGGNIEEGALRLPPVQRSAVWTPRKIIDLWDSVLRGLPIGVFYLVQRGEEARSRGPAPDALLESWEPGWDLLDGQQRLRALLLGGHRDLRAANDKRCLWVDLKGTPKSHILNLHLTSESQPFGYDPESGSRLPIAQRRAACDAIEPVLRQPTGEDGGDDRRAYTHELFTGFINGSLKPRDDVVGLQAGWPPLPFASERASTAFYPLHELLTEWRGAGWQREQRLRERTAGCKPAAGVLEKLHAAFKRIEKAEVALIRVDLDRDKDGLMLLFDRIGAGGTPLTQEERLFSIYKHYQDGVHDAVTKIHFGETAASPAEPHYVLPRKRVGRVLPAVKIAASAIRIANARSSDKVEIGNGLPDLKTFIADIKVKDSKMRRQLDELLPCMEGGPTPFAEAFERLFDVLAYRGGGDRGLPRVMRTQLSSDLVQVLLFWIVSGKPDNETIERTRPDLIRFVLFWRLCVHSENRAGTICFQRLREQGGVAAPFLGLYLTLCKKDEALEVPPPEAIRKIFETTPAAARWRSPAERFPERGVDGPVQFARRWWWSEAASLMWLQRDYLETSFTDFDPSSGRDDETPYDVDHIVPCADWRRYWSDAFCTHLGAVLDSTEVGAFKDAREILGQSIGNKWLVDFSKNRKWGDAKWKEKLDELLDSSMLAEKEKPDWTIAWGDDTITAAVQRPWDRTRLRIFQQVIEQRAASLYERYYREAEFAAWDAETSM